jgi:hypothetical protein
MKEKMQNFKFSKKEDVILNVEELTTIIKVQIKLFLNEDDVNLLCFEGNPKATSKRYAFHHDLE